MPSTLDLDSLHTQIDVAINPLGGNPKIKGSALNNILHVLAAALPDPTTPTTTTAGVQQVASSAALPFPPLFPTALYLTLDNGYLYRWDVPTATYVDLTAGIALALADKLSLSEPGIQTVHSELVLENGGVDTLKFYDGDFEGTANTRVGWRATDAGAAVDVGLMRQQAGVIKVVGTGTNDYAQLEAADVVAHQAPASLNSIAKLAAATASAQTRLDTPADIVGPTHGGVAYPSLYAATRAAQAGDTVRLHGPVVDPATADGEAAVDMYPDVIVHLHGHDVRSPAPNFDVVTLRGGRNVLVGSHATITQHPSDRAGGWLVGAYGNATLDAAIYDVHLSMTTYNSVGFALFGTGTLHYRGNVTSVGRYVARLSPGTKPLLLSGEGSITQQDGTIFWLQTSSARVEWRGDITALGSASFNLEAGTVLLRQGYLHAETRPAGAETVFVKNGPDTTLILENYTVQGVPGTTVLNVGTLVLRGSSAVIGNIVADKIIDERPATSTSTTGGTSGVPAAPAALTLPDGVAMRVAEFTPIPNRSVQAYEITLDSGATWQPATSPSIPVPMAGVAADTIGVRVAATIDGVAASAPTYLPTTGAVGYRLGLRARYYEGFLGWTPDFSLLDKTPLFEEVVEHAGSFYDPFFNNYGQVSKSLDVFSVRFDSYLHIKEAGQYSFTSSADDIGGLWLDDAVHQPLTQATRADNNGQSYYLEVGMHPICMAFSENYGDQCANYYWNGPGVVDFLNAGRLYLLTNSPVANDEQHAPAGLLLDPDFDQEMSAATWSPARGWDIVNGVLLGTGTAETITTLTLPTAALQDTYTIEVSLEIAVEARLIVECNGLIISDNILTTSGVHRLPATATTENINIRLRADNGNLVKVHYVQLIHG